MAAKVSEHRDIWAARRFTDNVNIAVGIDLGTTNSCVAVWLAHEKQVKIIGDIETDKSTMPSILAFSPDHEISSPIFGLDAKALIEKNPMCGMYNVKRFIGRHFDDSEVQLQLETQPFSIKPRTKRYGDTDQVSELCIEIDHNGRKHEFLPEEVSGKILAHLREKAETFLGQKVRSAVVTVPAYFNYSQRLATRSAALRAGFTEIELFSEPTAAAVAYGLFVAGRKNIVVFDLGGGTFDVAALHIDNGKFTVLATSGDTHLGGVDFDLLIAQEVIRMLHDSKGSFKSKTSKRKLKKSKFSKSTQRKGDYSNSDLHSLLRACELAKCKLSEINCNEVDIKWEEGNNTCDNSVPNSNNTTNNKNFYSVRFSRSDMDRVCAPLISRCLSETQKCLDAASLKPSDVQEVVLVGGSTQMLKVRTELSKLFNSKELCTAINVDEVVAEGAAIKAAILSGQSKSVLNDVLMFDVIPQALGVGSDCGSFIPIIPKNSHIPCTANHIFYTAEDNQAGVSVNVYEKGECIHSKHIVDGQGVPLSQCNYITQFDFPISKSSRGKAGAVAVNVEFTVNASGCIKVTATSGDPEKLQKENDQSFYKLCVFAFLIFFLYLFVKITINQTKLQKQFEL